MTNPLFEAFPGLRDRIPWIPLGAFPTPVHRLANVGGSNLWIKRDDESSAVYGGNKVRKLEFALGGAIAAGEKKVVTMGALGTNHGLATAIFCRRLGLDCRLLLFDQPVTRAVKRNLLLFHAYGADLAWYATMLRTGAMFRTWERLLNPNACFLPSGGSSALGTIGVVNAVFELKRQIDEGVMPEPNYIFTPLGSNGTMAGLQLGLLLAGLRTAVVGVRVSADAIGPLELATPRMVSALMRKTYRMLRAASSEIPAITIPALQVLNNYFGSGYGYPTRKGHEATDILRDRENIRLDPTYTAKTFAAVLDLVRTDLSSKDVTLYWHTYSAADLDAQARVVDYHSLPERFHWVFE